MHAVKVKIKDGNPDIDNQGASYHSKNRISNIPKQNKGKNAKIPNIKKNNL